MPTLIDLRDKVDEMLHQIRTVVHIQTPIITCPKCGKTGHAAEPRVSARAMIGVRVCAMILALALFEIAPKEQAKALEGSRPAAQFQPRRQIPQVTNCGPQSHPYS
jgi:hypothetical protein